MMDTTPASIQEPRNPWGLPQSEIERRINCVHRFFRYFVELNRDIPTHLNEASRADVFGKLEFFFVQNIQYLPRVLSMIQKSGTAAPVQQVSRRARLRSWIVGSVPLSMKVRLARSRLVSSLYRRLFIQPEQAPKPSFIDQLGMAHLEDLARFIVYEHMDEFSEAQAYAEDLEAHDVPVDVFVTHLFPTTWSPLVNALNAKGRHTSWCGMHDVKEFTGYGVLENRIVPTTSQKKLTFLGMLYAISILNKPNVLLSGECFYGSNWHFENTVVMYGLLNAVVAARRWTNPTSKNLVYMMYDGIKPISDRVQGGGDYEPAANIVKVLYGSFMGGADKIIYNSNGDIFGEFNELSLGLTAPRLHLFRYSEPPIQRRDRPPLKEGDEIHMACITVVLSEFHEPSRNAVTGFVRKFVENGVHFHYYCDEKSPAVPKFRSSLSENGKKYFHTHPIVKNQAALVEELQQYHVGFNPSDHVPFARGISLVGCRFLQDAMTVFWQSTIGTSFLVYAASGLPVILPRGCVSAVEVLGKDTVIPLTFSEFEEVENLFASAGFREKVNKAPENMTRFHINQHIDEFVDFMDA